MKKIYVIFVAVLLSCAAFGQEIKTGWKELDTFHQMVPPYLHTAVAGETEPIRHNSAVLLAAARKWQASKAPKGADTPEYQAGLAELVKECADLDAAVKANHPDAAISALADKAHKTFHRILAKTVIHP